MRALINKPVLLLADEPTGSLDGSTANALTGLLGELNKEEQVALIVVTHSTKLAQHMQKVYSLKNGILESE